MPWLGSFDLLNCVLCRPTPRMVPTACNAVTGLQAGSKCDVEQPKKKRRLPQRRRLFQWANGLKICRGAISLESRSTAPKQAKLLCCALSRVAGSTGGPRLFAGSARRSAWHSSGTLIARFAGGCVATASTAECGNFNDDNDLRSSLLLYNSD